MDIASISKSNVLSTESSGPADIIMEDIQYLLQLEGIRRYSDDFKNIQRQVEEHSRLWVETKLEYLALYKGLIELIKEVGIRQALDMELNPENVKDTTDIVASVSTMRSILSSDKWPMQLNEKDLQETTEHLRAKHKPRHNLDKQQRIFEENYQTEKSIAEMMENVKKLMESLIQLAMNQSVIEVSLGAQNEGNS